MKAPLPGPAHAACLMMARQLAQMEVEIIAAFAGVYDADAVRLAIADICLRRAVAAGLTDAPAVVVRAVPVKRRR